MDVISIFGVIAGIIFLGFIAELIFKKFNIPDVLLLIGVGILIGTYMQWASAETFGEGAKLFTSFALVFILFQGALSIDIKTLIQSLNSSLKLTVLSFILTIGVITTISIFMGYDLLIALLIGTILAGTSSAVVIPLVANLKELSDKHSLILTLESAISDVLCIIGTITILEILKEGNVVASEIFRNILSSFIFALVIGILAGIIWIIIMKDFEAIGKSYMLTIAFVIALYAFVESSWVQASGAIAALSFGLVLGNSKTILKISNKNNSENEKNDENGNKKKKFENKQIIRSVITPKAMDFYSEISFFVKTFFFVYLGILIDFSNMIVFIYGLILTIGVFLIRPFVVKLAFFKEHIQNNERAILEVMVPKGLAAAVLAGVAVQSGLLIEHASSFVNLILSVVLISIIFTSVLVFLIEKNWFIGFFPFLRKKSEN